MSFSLVGPNEIFVSFEPVGPNEIVVVSELVRRIIANFKGEGGSFM